jgi:hypothetical protein
MNEKPASGDDKWWSVPQAIAWIVSLDEWEVARVRGIDLFEQLPCLPTCQSTGRPPISQTEAPLEFLKAWREGHLEILGTGKGGQETIPRPPAHRGAGFIEIYKRGLSLRMESIASIEGDRIVRDSPYWSRLWVRPEQCKARWPAPPLSLPPGRTPTEFAANAKPDGRSVVPSPAPATVTPDPAPLVPPLRKIGRGGTLVDQAREALRSLFPDGEVAGSYSELITRIEAAEGKRFEIDVIRRALDRKS